MSGRSGLGSTSCRNREELRGAEPTDPCEEDTSEEVEADGAKERAVLGLADRIARPRCQDELDGNWVLSMVVPYDMAEAWERGGCWCVLDE